MHPVIWSQLATDRQRELIAEAETQRRLGRVARHRARWSASAFGLRRRVGATGLPASSVCRS